MPSFTVKLNFDDGVNDYDLPHVFSISDPQQGMKAVVIEGNRADGSIVIPGGKRSHEITVRGTIIDNSGYENITDLMATMREKITTDSATLTLEHWNGATWETDWAYQVRRIDEISFPESLRIVDQTYEIKFLVTGY